jgi:diguanylate cyclase (GGDEF)-like protein
MPASILIVKRVNFKNWMFTAGMSRIALSAIVSIMAGLSIFALWQTITVTDEVDRDRAAVAINAMLLNHVQRLEIYTAEQAYSDELAQELYSEATSTNTIRDIWLESSLGDEHDIGFAYGSDGNQKFAVSAGEISNTNYRASHKRAIAALTARITATSDCVGGIIWTQGGARVLTVARVRPISNESLSLAVRNRPAYIALSKPIEQSQLAHIGKLLGIKGIRIAPVRKEQTGLTTTAVAHQVGDNKIEIIWQPARPGNEALLKSLPLILVAFIVGVAFVSLLSRLIGKLLSAALRDTLSHLPNRRSLELNIAREASSKKRPVLAVLDIDGFKRINDNYGAHVGDQAIKAIADFLVRHVPNEATVARLGGDEFAVLMPDARNSEELKAVVQAFQNHLTKPLVVGNFQLQLSATIGISGGQDGNADSKDDLILHCDRALAAAKRYSRGQILVYDDALAAEFADAAALAAKVEQALAHDLLDMHFQPLVEARDGRITAAEALMRWKPEAGITVGPETIIAAAESHGIGLRLALAVIDGACRHGALWPHIKIAANITPAQFLDPELPQHIADILARHKMPAERLELEVTESIAIADEVIFSQQFEKLRAMDVQLALDDFGSGYASIGFLRQFSFQKLKIDKSLVDDCIARVAGRDMLIACVSAARALGIRTVAEGIETSEHQDIARAAGCDLLQGYYLGRPMTSGEFTKVIGALTNKAA